MEQLYNLNLCHLVLSPNVRDSEKFKTFLPFINNWIFKKSNVSFYSISEEMGEKSHYHLDILIFSKSDIDKNILNNKGNQIGLSGHLKTFMVENLPSTQWGIFYKDQKENIKKEKEHNIKFLIGYNKKETRVDPSLQNYNTLPISKEDEEICHKYFLEHQIIKTKITKDIIPLNSKNAMFEMKKYLTDTKTPNFNILISETIMKGYCWIGMSKTQIRKLILQLKLIKEQATDDEINEINEDCFKKFEENQEFEMLKCNRTGPNRLQMLKEYQFISEEEYKILSTRLQ